MNCKNILGVFLIFTLICLTGTVGSAQETSGSADPVDQVVATPDDTSHIASGKAVFADGNEPIGQPGLGGAVSSDVVPEDLGDEASLASNSQILSEGGEVIEVEEDLSAEPGLGGETSAEPLLLPDIDSEDQAEAAADAN
jgi:hypothetical protein